jgi:hypothetical protein
MPKVFEDRDNILPGKLKREQTMDSPVRADTALKGTQFILHTAHCRLEIVHAGAHPNDKVTK